MNRRVPVVGACIIAIVLLVSGGRCLLHRRSDRLPAPFPLPGYLLVNERNELTWYRVSVPENEWSRIAAGSFMLDQEYSVEQNGNECSLTKVEGDKIHNVDLRTGKETFTPIPPNTSEPKENEWRYGPWTILLSGSEWTIRKGNSQRHIPVVADSTGASPAWAAYSWDGAHHVLFLKTTRPTDTSIQFDLMLLDTESGQWKLAYSVPPDNVQFIQDPEARRTFFLNTSGKLECWGWSGGNFQKQGDWQLPPTDSNESYGGLLAVVQKEWVLYDTLIDPSVFLFSQSLRPKYYGYNLRTKQWAIVLDQPGNHKGDAVAWIAR